ncbi:MAG TPA: efflux transporter outer membrane subunit [Burkholderiales bacterium]|nr:efflux transporter outer membrane subunit [Burkholderiales bacterium]
MRTLFMPTLAPTLRRFPLLGLCAIALCACTPVVTEYARPSIDLPAPPPQPILIHHDWWKGFGDPVLDRLVVEALANNFDLAKAAANIAEARANAGAARALLSPRVDAFADTGIGRREFSLGEEDLDRRTSLSRAGLGASWEIDLWGRIRQMNDAALARASASEFTRNATELSISAAVAENYFMLRALDEKLLITRDSLANLKGVSNLEYRRWQGQAGTELAYRQSLAESFSVEARLPEIEFAISRTELALKLLVGRSPRAMTDTISRGNNAIRLANVPRMVDSTLLLRRPDVASAEQLLIAANADVNSVRAERYPRINLSLIGAFVGSSSGVVSGMPFFWDAGAGVSAPVFDAGLIESKTEAAEARRVNAVAHYSYVVSQAFSDVYDSLYMLDNSDRQVKSFEDEVVARRKSLALNQKSYDAGRTSKYEVLDETIKALNTDLLLVDARLNQLIARCRYYKALGGGY